MILDFEYAIKLWLREYALPHPYTSGTLLLDPAKVTTETVGSFHRDLEGGALQEKVRTMRAQAEENVDTNFRIGTLIHDARNVAILRETVAWALNDTSPLDAYSTSQMRGALRVGLAVERVEDAWAFDIEVGLQAIGSGQHNARSWFFHGGK